MYVMYLAELRVAARGPSRRTTSASAFADVFASLKRAPQPGRRRHRARYPASSAVETRIVDAGQAGRSAAAPSPAIGRLVSVPGRPATRALNDLYLRRGRWVEPDRSDEVSPAKASCDAHGFVPGDAVAAIDQRPVAASAGSSGWRSRRNTSTASGLARWCRTTVASAFSGWGSGRSPDCSTWTGGFNDVTLAVAPGASTPDVVDRLDRLLERYGGLGATPRSLQFSHWTLESELSQLQQLRVPLAVALPQRRRVHAATSPLAAPWRCSARRSPPSRRSVIPMPPSDGTT